MDPIVTGTIIGTAGNLAMTGYNNLLSARMTAHDRAQNYMYNQWAAASADLRTRRLYNDLYSPEALMKQYKAAGLSPSLMFGGTPGQGGMQSPAGAGVSGPQTPYMPVSMLEGAQIANIMAQTQKTKAETKNIESKTTGQDLANKYQEMTNNLKFVDFDITTAVVTDTNGQEMTLYEIAEQHWTYDGFMNEIKGLNMSEELKKEIHTEQGQKTLRAIFITRHRMNTEIEVLSSEKTSAKFQEDLLNAMRSQDFINLNAEAAVAYLKSNIQSAELTERQKEAWNNLIKKLEKKGTTMTDIVIVAGMILNQAAAHWHMPTIETGDKNITVNK